MKVTVDERREVEDAAAALLRAALDLYHAAQRPRTSTPDDGLDVVRWERAYDALARALARNRAAMDASPPSPRVPEEFRR